MGKAVAKTLWQREKYLFVFFMSFIEIATHTDFESIFLRFFNEILYKVQPHFKRVNRVQIKQLNNSLNKNERNCFNSSWCDPQLIFFHPVDVDKSAIPLFGFVFSLIFFSFVVFFFTFPNKWSKGASTNFSMNQLASSAQQALSVKVFLGIDKRNSNRMC